MPREDEDRIQGEDREYVSETVLYSRRRQACANCSHWHILYKENGNCRAHPPIMVNGDWDFPITQEDWWCGEFQLNDIWRKAD